eukprot:Opistho-2@62974
MRSGCDAYAIQRGIWDHICTSVAAMGLLGGLARRVPLALARTIIATPACVARLSTGTTARLAAFSPSVAAATRPCWNVYVISSAAVRQASTVSGRGMMARFVLEAASRHVGAASQEYRLASSSIPRGFGKFYPPQKRQSDSAQDSTGKDQSDNEDKGGNSNPLGSGEGGPGMPWTVLALLLVPYALMRAAETLPAATTFQDFVADMLSKGEVDKLEVDLDDAVVRVWLHPGAILRGHPYRPADSRGPHFVIEIPSVALFEERMERIQDEMGIPPSDRVPVAYRIVSITFDDIAAVLLPIGMFALFTFLSRRATMGMRGGGGMSPFSMGSAKPTVVGGNKATVKFANVAGMGQAKVEVMEFVSFLKDPERFTELGAKVPKGALLSGPPGTGKTLLAKAVAGEAEVPFFSMSGSDFVEIFVGVGPARVRDLFAQARKSAPCIIFIDEID